MAHSESWTLDALIEAYKQHQQGTRGLRERTITGYERLVRLFIRAAHEDGPIDPTKFNPSDVIDFIGLLRGRYSPRSMKAVRTALRSFFRFLRAEGLCDERLEAAIPAVAHWRLSTLPRCLSEGQLSRVLSSFDPATSFGRRDRAIVLCLSTLGLRPGEVAGLCLDDLDWRSGTIHLRTRKTGRGAVLPLPREAGRAIVTYLRRGRPESAERHVFLQHHGSSKGRPLSSNALSAVAVRAFQRAEVESPLAGAYVFRHTVASRLVQRGVSLKEVADFLGHRSLDTTAIYAKLDLPALRDVAMPWPEAIQ